MEVLPAEAGAELVQEPDVAWWGRFGVGVVEVGEAVVAGHSRRPLNWSVR